MIVCRHALFDDKVVWWNSIGLTTRVLWLHLQERKEGGKRGRKPGRKASAEKIDIKAKLERSRQSARECRARKKLRYQYLEELVTDREKAVLSLRNELERVS